MNNLRPRWYSSSALSALLVVAVVAQADTNGFYLGAGIGRSVSDLDASTVTEPLVASGISVVGQSLDDVDAGWRLFAGYQVNSFLAAEIGYVDLGKNRIQAVIGGDNPGTIDTSLSMDGVNLGVKAGYPVTEKIAGFAKLGAFVWGADADAEANLVAGTGSSEESDNGTGLSYGLGLSYSLTEEIAVRGEWDRYQLGGDTDVDVNLWSLNLQYFF